MRPTLLIYQLPLILSCPTWLATRDSTHSTSHYCKLEEFKLSHENFIQQMCSHKLFHKRLLKDPTHNDHLERSGDAGKWKCSTKTVRVLGRRNSFPWKKCSKNVRNIESIKKFTHSDANDFCRSYSQQFQYKQTSVDTIAALCRPYFVHSSKQKGEIMKLSKSSKPSSLEHIQMSEADKQSFAQECCHQRITNQDSIDYSIDCYSHFKSHEDGQHNSSHEL